EAFCPAHCVRCDRDVIFDAVHLRTLPCITLSQKCFEPDSSLSELPLHLIFGPPDGLRDSRRSPSVDVLELDDGLLAFRHLRQRELELLRHDERVERIIMLVLRKASLPVRRLRAIGEWRNGVPRAPAAVPAEHFPGDFKEIPLRVLYLTKVNLVLLQVLEHLLQQVLRIRRPPA